MQDPPEASLRFPCGATMKNRFMLAPMTNTQSFEDGQLAEDELNWLRMRAEGQFGLVMTCAAHVQGIGKGFPGQLGIFGDHLLSGHERIAKTIHDHGGLAVVQLHHAGMRAPAELIGQPPVCPSNNEKYGARGLSLFETEILRDDFIRAAVRAQKAGYDGVEVHGAHGYILTQYLSPKINRRTDAFGGSLGNRARLLFQIVAGIRKQCGPSFVIGVRLSPERFGMDLGEIKQICRKFIENDQIDFLDISLWDCFKYPEEEAYQDKTLLQHFTELNYNKVKLTVAGKIRSGGDVRKVLNAGVDFVAIGRSAILHHDFPQLVLKDPNFQPVERPVSVAYLKQEGLGPKFIEYMRRWPNFVEQKAPN